MLGIKGSGKLEIAGQEFPFENRVNFNFLMSPQNLIDLQLISGSPYKSFGLREVPAVGFTLCSNPIDTTLSGIYNRLGFIAMGSFATVLITPLKTVLRGAGLVTTAGTVRSGGFNMVCTEGAVGGVVPYVNMSRRRADLRVSNVGNLPFANNWVYHPVKKALYRYAPDSADIHKIPFDLDTGIIGTSSTLLTSGFTPNPQTFYRYIMTDGYNRIWRFTNSNRNEIAVFDFTSETLSIVPLTSAVSLQTDDFSNAWDEFNQKHIFGQSSTTWTRMALDGTIDTIPAPRSQLSGIRVFKELYAIDQAKITRPYEVEAMAYTDVNHTVQNNWVNMISDKQYRILDSNGWIVRGTFNSAVTPGLLTLEFFKEPEMAMSMLSIPPVAVDVDTPFSIEYTFEVIDNR